MATDDVKITNWPDNSLERVAFDLMTKIEYHESEPKKDRAYYLDLFIECRKAVKLGQRRG